MFGGNCAYCGHPLGERWHADHVEPVMRQTKYVSDDYGRGKFVQTGKLYRPENDREDNYFPACVPCNIDKSCSEVEAWRRQLQDKINVALRASTPLRHAQRFGLVQFSEAPIVFYFEKFRATETAAGGD
jgi:hypothetical protein